MKAGDDVCPAVWRGAGPSCRCGLPDSAEAHAEPMVYDAAGEHPRRIPSPCHAQWTPNGYTAWGITIEDRARWAAYQAASLA